jgi:hypothetical protein
MTRCPCARACRVISNPMPRFTPVIKYVSAMGATPPLVELFQKYKFDAAAVILRYTGDTLNWPVRCLVRLQAHHQFKYDLGVLDVMRSFNVMSGTVNSYVFSIRKATLLWISFRRFIRRKSFATASTSSFSCIEKKKK